MAASTMAKPLPAKLNPAHDAAVRRMLATPSHLKKSVKKVAKEKLNRSASGSR